MGGRKCDGKAVAVGEENLAKREVSDIRGVWVIATKNRMVLQPNLRETSFSVPMLQLD